ncbi:flavoprotein%2C HI0933 family [uncultured Eubacterium sp.]|nr:flavoprotein%2C HI0933 family [uncultured Eubacterium sp.]
MTYDCIIIGAGAAGLFCSASFKKPVRGLLLEKTKRPGTKLLMSGGGQCNITHDGSIKDFVKCYGKNGGKIRSCLYRYSNEHLLHFLHEGGVRTITREDGKIFPASMDAHEIRDLLLTKSRENGFTIQYESPVCRIQKKDDGLWQVFTSEKSYLCKNLVIASGGCSYPSTGSDGSLFPVLRNLGIEITPLRPGLSPVNVKNYPYGEISGISFDEVHLSVWRSEKKTAEAVGGLLFTHSNLSGPLILNSSKEIRPGDTIKLNYLYPETKSAVAEKISGSLKNSKTSLQNLLPKELGLPKSFLQVILKETGDRQKEIAARLTADSFLVDSVSGYNKAMVTTGGITLSEINPKSMELKRFAGLYAIGEVLDVDGFTGGYNLQFAYSSANAASSNMTDAQKPLSRD